MSSIAANDVVQTNSLVWFRNDLRVDDHNPRDRKFNIKFQAERYDPLNKYQNMWLQKRLFV